MPKKPWLIKNNKPPYQVLKWIGGGGFGQVYKVIRNGQIVACKQVHVENAEAALDEYDHMRAVRGAPHIAALHDGLEYNTTTNTLSFFMDYYRGKDLDRQVQMLRGAAERFSESQVVEIGYQIAVALELCHNKNILHQDMKPMNILLDKPWNPITQRDVPDLFIADFGIATQVQTMATRVTGRRGTPGYEAPEIRGYRAAFSQKSDIYAFGCILYRLCALEDPVCLDDIQPTDIPEDYVLALRNLISTMLSSDRDSRPTASQVKEQLAGIAKQMFLAQATPIACRTCQATFPSRSSLTKHLKETGHNKKQASSGVPLSARLNVPLSAKMTKDDLPSPLNTGNTELRIRGAAGTPSKHYYDETDGEEDTLPPCVVCWRGYESKHKLFRHLYCGKHVRRPNVVTKRLAEAGDDGEETKKRQRA